MDMRLAVVAVLAVTAASRAAQGAAQAAAFTDQEIVGGILAAEQLQLEAAETVAERSARSDVKSFAQRMKKEHAASAERLAGLAAAGKLEPADSDFALGLRSRGQDLAGELRLLAGGGFDRAYVDGMVAEHQALLDALDQRMIPGAQDEKLKSHLRKTRSMVLDHLREARRIQGRIATGRGGERERAVGPQEGSYP